MAENVNPWEDYQGAQGVSGTPTTTGNPWEDYQATTPVSTISSAPAGYAQKGRDINAQYKAWQAKQAEIAATPAETTPKQKAEMAAWLQEQADLANPMMVGQGGLTPESVQTQAGAYQLQQKAQEQQAAMRSDLYGKGEKEQRAWQPNTLEYLANPEVSFGAKALTTLTGGVSIMPFEELDPMSFSSPAAYNKARTGQVVAELISNPILYAPIGWSGLPANFETKLAKVLETVPTNTSIKDTMGMVTKELQKKGEIKAPVVTKSNYDEPLSTSLTKEEPSVKMDEQVSQNPLLQLKVQNEHEYYRTLDNNLDPAVFKTLDVPTQEATLKALKSETFTSRTGLGNRAAYYQKLNEKIAKGEQPKTIFFDASGLKNVNDNLGHTAGDAFLNAFGDIAKRIYGKDNSFHISGDEFVAFAKNDEEASRLRAKFDEAAAAHKFEIVDNHGNVHQIDGIKAVSGHGNSLKEADAAVNKFKDEGAIQDVLSGKINPQDLARRHIDLALKPDTSPEYRQATTNLFLQRIEQLSKQEPSVQANKGDTAERGVLQGTGQEVRGVEENLPAKPTEEQIEQQAAELTKSSPTASPVVNGEGQVIDASFNREIQDAKQNVVDQDGFVRFSSPDSVPDSTQKLDKVFNKDILAYYADELPYKNLIYYYNKFIRQPMESAELLAKHGYKTSLHIMQRANSLITRTAKRQYDFKINYADPLDKYWNSFNLKQKEDLVKAQEISLQENRLLEPVEYYARGKELYNEGLVLNANQMDYLTLQQQSFRKAWDDIVDMMRAKNVPEETIQQFIENSKGYYLPTTRKGDKITMVFDNVTNKVIASVGSSGKAEHQAVLKHLSEKFPDAETHSIKTMDNIPSKYEGEEMSMVMFDKLKNRAQDVLNEELDAQGGILKEYFNLNVDPVVIAMQNSIKQKGPAYMKKKKSIAGYDTDFHQFTKEYYASVSGYIENQLFKHDLYDTTKDMSGEMIGLWHQFEKEQGQKSRWKDELAGHLDYLQKPGEEAAKVRALMFSYFLATNPSSMILNFSNLVTTLIPSLTSHGAGIGNAEKQTIAAITKLTHKDKLLRPDEKKLIDYMTEQGDINQFLRSELTGHGSGQVSDFLKPSYYEEQLKAKTVMGKIGKTAQLPLSMITTAGGQAFGNLDQYTRMVAGLAYYNTALKLMKEQPKKWEQIKNELHLVGLDDFELAADFASKGSKKTMFDYSKANLPNISKGRVARVFFQFKMFALSYAKLLFSLTGNSLKSPAQFSAAVKAWGILITLSGVGGVPFGKYIDALVNDVTGQDTDHWVKKWLGDNFMSKTLGRGVFSNFGVDVAKRLGIAVVPEISESNKDKTNTEKIMHTLAISAPAIGFAMNMETGGKDIARGIAQLTGVDRTLKLKPSKFTPEENIIKGLEKMSPTGIANVFKVLRWTIDGDTVRDKNNKVIISHVSASEKLIKLLGFMPERHSVQYGYMREQKSGQ